MTYQEKCRWCKRIRECLKGKYPNELYTDKHFTFLLALAVRCWHLKIFKRT